MLEVTSKIGGDWGWCWPPWDCPSEPVTPVSPGEDRGVIEEIQYLGRVKTTCAIRKLQKIANGYLVCQQEAERQKRSDVAQRCVDSRVQINSVVDYLYGAIDLYFGGEEGREGPVPGSACLDGLGATISVSPGIILGVAAILVTGGVIAYITFKVGDLAGEAQTLGFCKLEDYTPEQCAKMIEARKPDDPIASIGKTVGIGVVALLGAYLAYRIIDSRIKRRRDGVGSIGDAHAIEDLLTKDLCKKYSDGGSPCDLAEQDKHIAAAYYDAAMMSWDDKKTYIKLLNLANKYSKGY